MTYRNGSMREKDETGFNNMEMTPFRKAIVFGCVRWNSKMRYTMKNKKINKGNIFTTIIRLQCIDALIEVFFVMAWNLMNMAFTRLQCIIFILINKN
jgi:hypothetical protein